MSDAQQGFAIRHNRIILFVALALCLAGAYSAYRMPSAVFPQTDFPRVVIMIDNGVMPSDEMMATITRPIEDIMKAIPGVVNIRSATARGGAAIDVFFTWSTDMTQSELYVLGRLAQIRGDLPPGATYQVHRMTFSSFPIVGVSLTSPTRNITELWETAEYQIKPRFLRIDGVARVDLSGGRRPEYHVEVDPAKLAAHHLSLAQVSDALVKTNLYTPAGMHEENKQLYLTITDGRARKPEELLDVPIASVDATPVYVKDVATVSRGPSPAYNIITADGVDAVLLNVRSQPDGNTIGIANALKKEMSDLKAELPPDVRLAFYYDQSLFVREGVRSVWESIGFGLVLSIVVLYLFLRNVPATFVTILAIPVTVLATLAGMRLFHMSFNLMTLGGIAAAIGLVIDDAIVAVEAIYTKAAAGHTPQEAVRLAIREVGPPLVGSTLTPVVVFLPLAYLDGVPGVFFRALALTMVCALLVSLALAVTMTPALAVYVVGRKRGPAQDELEQGGPILRRVVGLYEWTVRRALRFKWLTVLAMIGVMIGAVLLYGRLESDFLPEQDEGAFVLDYFSRPGTSLSETDRMLRDVEVILRATPDVEGYSRRTGARLAEALAEPNTGDYVVKLKPSRSRSTQAVINELREKISAAEPALHIEFPGILSDLIGDLTWSPNPIEVKVFSPDPAVLKSAAARIAKEIATIPGIVDVNDGVVVAGPSLVFRVRPVESLRAGLTAADIGATVETALEGKVVSTVLEKDRILDVRVLAAGARTAPESAIALLPVQATNGSEVVLDNVAGIEHEAGLLEIQREDQRVRVAVSARLSGRDLGSGVEAIRQKLAATFETPPGATIEYGGLYQQQQESFRNLTFVLLMAIILVFGVLIFEFNSLLAPLAIVIGAVLALFGVVGALWITDTSLNIVSFLSAIIGFGIVAKNGILMLDFVGQLQKRGFTLVESLVQSGRRRLRPVLMTSLTAFLGLLPLAYGVGAGADMLRPLAIGVIGALAMSLLLSLVATPVVYYLLARTKDEG